MKIPFALILGLLTCIPFVCGAQNNPGQTLKTPIPASTPYGIKAQDGNSRIWERTVYELDPTGQPVPKKRQYTEMASGLNHLVNGQWVESKELIEILPNGTAIATNGQHQAYFPGDIYEGQIELVTPDGKHLVSRPFSLSYFDGTNTVVLAELTNSVGIVAGENQVIYPNAFTGLKADLRYTYTKAGFEQDVILHQQPPTPESLDLNADTARLQVLTEFFSPPTPTITSAKMASQAGMSLTDQNLDFGATHMVPGRAFLLGTNAVNAKARVSKHWLPVQGRQFLLEEVPVDAILEGLAGLPRTAINSGPNKNFRTASKELVLPPQRLANKNTSKSMLIARAGLPTEGFVLDYQTASGNVTNYTFQADMTYYISGNLNLYGTTTIEGGTVIKYGSSSTAYVNVLGSFSCRTDGYRPAVLTAKDDNSQGEAITGSSGSPSGYYGGFGLFLQGGGQVSGLRACYLSTVMVLDGTDSSISDIQAINCGNVFVANNDNGSMTVNNGLFYGDQTIFFVQDTWQVAGTHLTAHNCAYFCDFGGSTYCLTNCLLVTVTNWDGGGITSTFLTNAVVSLSTDAGVFQTVGGGRHYLATNSIYRDVGTTNLAPAVLKDIRAKTTYPPLLYSNINLTTTLSPQAQRDTDAPDLGYHYDPLDYLIGGCDLYSNLTVTTGTAIGWFSSVGSVPSASQGYGISLNKGANLTYSGTVTNPCWMASYHTVQEGYLTPVGYFGALMPSTSGSGAIPQLNATFTKWSVLTADGNNFRDNYANGAATFANCEFYVGGLMPYDMSSTIYTNCLFFRTQNYYFGYMSSYAPYTTYENCTFYNGFLALNRYSGQPASVWIVQNTAFDGTGFSTGDNYNGDTNYTRFDYNAYNTNNNSGLSYPYPYTPPPTNRLETIGAHDVFVGTYNWQSSWFGSFYQPTNSLLINVGSTTANLLGLYHFTTQTNQVKETNSIVDIGYHYVAVDANGNPLDNNGDGIPDYLQDANGNGLVDNGEAPWNFPATNLVLWLKADALTGLANNTQIATWSDNSGMGHDATQSTSVKQPLYVTNILNGLPVMRFNGTSSCFDLPDYLGSASGEEAFLVIQAATNLPTTPQYIWEGGNIGARGPLQYPAVGGHILDGTASTANSYDLGVPSQPLTNYNVYEVSGTNGSWAAWLDGQLLDSSSVNTYSPSVTGFSLGYDTYNNGYYFGGNIAEVLVFNRTLTGAERLTVNNYLNFKYGLVTAVPATPTNLVAKAISTNQISLTWNETFNWGGTLINVQRATASNGTYQVVAQLGEALAYVDTNLASGTTYYYQVTAVNAVGNSAGSNLAWATTTNGGVSLPLGDLVLWLKADSGLAQSGTNTPVSLWADQSGNANHGTQPAQGNQPTWVAQALNGLPVMRFNGTSSYFNLPDYLVGTSGEEVFFVIQAATNLPTTAQYVWEGGAISAHGPLQYPAVGGHILDGTASSANSYDLGVPSQPLTNYNVYEVSGTNGSWAAWLDGQLLGSSSVNTYGTSISGYGLGYDPYYHTYFFAGNIAEVLVFNRTLTGAERLTVNNYLNFKYGLVTAVPATPTNLVAKAISTNQISLTWNETFNWGGTLINVQRATASNGTYQVVAQLGEALAYVDTNLASGTTYYYQVTAVNAVGNSAGSNLAWATTTNGGVSLPLGDLVLWLKADSGLAQSGTNTPVSLWADQSGNANHGTQPAQGNQPTWVAQALNGLPVMRFNGTSSYFNLPDYLVGTSGEEVFFVIQAATNLPTTAQYVWEGGAISAHGPLQYPAVGGHILDGTASSANSYDLGVPSQPLTNYNVYEVSGTNGSWAAWLDGQLLGSSSVNTYGTSISGYGLGYDPYYHTYFFAGNIAEVLVFNRTLTGDEKVAVGAYLMTKYSLARYVTNTSLPSIPTNLVSKGISPYALNLQWVLKSTNATAIGVQRKLGTNGNYSEIGSSFIDTNYVDMTADPANQYFYRISAKNYFGQSAYSTEISPPVPNISLLSTNGYVATGVTNLIKVQASDAYGTVNQVKLSVGLNLINQNNIIGTTTSVPYTNKWVASFPATYVFAALATDTLGNSRYSAPLYLDSFKDSNGDGIPDYVQVLQGNNPLNPWIPPAVNTNDHTAPIITLLIPTNAIIVP